jgi:RND family efflux transporter MFP subunit
MVMTKIQVGLATMKKSMITGIVVIAAVIIVLGMGSMLLSVEAGHTNVPRRASALQAPVVTAEVRTVDDLITAAGALSSKNTSVLSSKVMGRVVVLNVQEGDTVTAGKLLLRIDSGEITAQMIQAQAAYNNAKLQYDRIKSLFDAKASTQMEMDQATLGLQTAEAGLKAAQAMESYTNITAPIPGQIVEKRINLGEMAMPGQPVLRIEDNRNLRLEATVRESDLMHIHAGTSVKVRIDAMPGRELRGRVAQVVPAADVRTHSFLVKIDIPAEKGLITGMYGKAFFSTGRRQAILVPKSAVVEMSGITGVYVVGAENKAIFQMVQLGGDQGSAVEVLTGLKAGARIVADNKLGRIEGRTIEATEK